MKILVSFSGGKDSQACLIQAFKQYGGGNLTAVFCDTGWEHPDTYKHVARNTLKYCEMKLNKKTERLIKRRAAELKKLYETPNPEVDKIISELRAEATKRPQNMSKEEEIAYILKKADENCDHIEIRKILNESNT